MGGEKDLVERAFGLLQSDTYEQVLPLIGDDFVMVTTPQVASEPQTYQGPDGVRLWWTQFLEVMATVNLDAVSFEDLGDGRVVVEFGLRARGRASGIEATQPAAAVVTVVDGKLRQLEVFSDRAQARSALG